MIGEDFPKFDDDRDMQVDGARPEVEGPNPFPTGSRIETSTDNYAAGAPPTDTNSWTVREARRRRSEQFGDSSIEIK